MFRGKKGLDFPKMAIRVGVQKLLLNGEGCQNGEVCQKGKIALLKKNKKNLNDINIFQDFKM